MHRNLSGEAGGDPRLRGLRLGSVWLGFAGLLALAHVFQCRQSGYLSVQGQTNLCFVAHPSLVEALTTYPKARPPLYPLLLWLAAQVGIQPFVVNELLFGTALFAFLVCAWRAWPKLHPLIPTGLFAVLSFNYPNLYQLTSEALVVPLILAFLLVIDRYWRHGDVGSLWRTAAVVSALCVTRYFCLCFAPPILGVAMLAREHGRWSRRLAKTAGVLALTAAPVVIWMTFAYAETGHVTGANRFEARRLPRKVQHWEELRGFRPTLRLVAKTYWIDFFSPDTHASLAVVTRPYATFPDEVATASLAALCGVVAVAAGFRAGRRSADPIPARLVFGLFTVYLGVTIAIWTFANNDPPYSRFLYPSYPFLVLLGFHGYDLARRSWSWFAYRVPFWALYSVLVLLHIRRDWLAIPVPFR